MRTVNSSRKRRFVFAGATIFVRPTLGAVRDGLIRCNFDCWIKPADGRSAMQCRAQAFYCWDAANIVYKDFMSKQETK